MGPESDQTPSEGFPYHQQHSKRRLIPDDVLENILKRLPVKSLLRFQCVCKHWKNLINSPFFIANHLQFSNQNPFLLICQRDHEQICLLDRDFQVQEIQNAPSNRHFRAHVIGSTNGLLCFKRFDGITRFPSFLLWNPSIGQEVQVPTTMNDLTGTFLAGFGFAPALKDYKIVLLHEPAGNNGSQNFSRVEVYSLGMRSWKEVDSQNLEYIYLVTDGVTITGAVVWGGSKRAKVGFQHDPVLVLFDLEQKFSKYKEPSTSYFNEISEYNNKLALLCPGVMSEQNIRKYDITALVMDDIDAWTEKFAIGPFPKPWYPATIWGNELISYVFMRNEEGVNDIEGEEYKPKATLSCFNLLTNKWTTFGTHRCVMFTTALTNETSSFSWRVLFEFDHAKLVSLLFYCVLFSFFIPSVAFVAILL